MPKPILLGAWVKCFLLDHLIAESNLSRNTQRSYRDTLALFPPYAADQQKTHVDRLDIFDLSADVLRSFLNHLEQIRGCSIRTRNQRLAAVHAMARFIAERSPEHIAWCGQIRSVPFKRFTRRDLSYLDKSEMDTLLASPDRRTAQGRRDHALLLFLYVAPVPALACNSQRVARDKSQPFARSTCLSQQTWAGYNASRDSLDAAQPCTKGLGVSPIASP